MNEQMCADTEENTVKWMQYCCLDTRGQNIFKKISVIHAYTGKGF